MQRQRGRNRYAVVYKRDTASATAANCRRRFTPNTTIAYVTSTTPLHMKIRKYCSSKILRTKRCETLAQTTRHVAVSVCYRSAPYDSLCFFDPLFFAPRWKAIGHGADQSRQPPVTPHTSGQNMRIFAIRQSYEADFHGFIIMSDNR